MSDTLTPPRSKTAFAKTPEFEEMLQRLVASSANPAATAERLARDEMASLSGSIRQHLGVYFDMHGAALPPDGLYDRLLAEVEKPLLEVALNACAGNQIRTAALLGINRNTLRKKMKRYHLGSWKGEGR